MRWTVPLFSQLRVSRINLARAERDAPYRKGRTQAFSLLDPRTLGRSAKQRGQQRQVELCYTGAREWRREGCRRRDAGWTCARNASMTFSLVLFAFIYLSFKLHNPRDTPRKGERRARRGCRYRGWLNLARLFRELTRGECNAM